VSQVRKISSSSGTYLCLMQGSACERWTLGGCSLLGIGFQIAKDIMILTIYVYEGVSPILYYKHHIF
jgi:hypothetical protein